MRPIKKKKKIILKSTKKKKLVRVHLGERLLKVKKETYEKFKGLGIAQLSKAQRFRTLELMKRREGKFLNRFMEIDEEIERGFFFCDAYSQRLSLDLCVQRLTNHPLSYRRCKVCKIVGEKILRTCIGIGFDEKSVACSVCDMSLSCRSILKFYMKRKSTQGETYEQRSDESDSGERG